MKRRGQNNRRYCSEACHTEQLRKRRKKYLHDWYLKQRDVLLRRNRGNLRTLLSAARAHAKRKGMVFDLTIEDLRAIDCDVCPVFGTPFETHGFDNGRRHPTLKSLDRIDSSRGYTRDNVWLISWRANDLKRDASLQELEQLVCALRARKK